MPKSELEKHYLDTTYSIFIDKNKFDIKIGQAIPLFINQLISQEKEKSAAIITAWNPRSQALSVKENQERNKDLCSSVTEKNYSIYDALGQGKDSTWPAEESFFVVGISKKQVELLAVEHKQNAYVWIENEKPVSLIFTKLWWSLRTE